MARSIGARADRTIRYQPIPRRAQAPPQDEVVSCASRADPHGSESRDATSRYCPPRERALASCELGRSLVFRCPRHVLLAQQPSRRGPSLPKKMLPSKGMPVCAVGATSVAPYSGYRRFFRFLRHFAPQEITNPRQFGDTSTHLAHQAVVQANDANLAVAALHAKKRTARRRTGRSFGPSYSRRTQPASCVPRRRVPPWND